MTSTDLITLEQVEHTLLHGGDVDIVSSEDVQHDMIQRILSAESLDDAFGGFQATPANEMDGIKISVRGIAWMKSAFQEGPKVYALLDSVVVETGEAVTISMGGATLMASFVYAQRQEAMPIEGTFRKRKSNANTERSFWTFDLT